MAKVEIDEIEYTQNKQLRDTVAKLMAHPKAAVLVEEARKLVEPEAPTPRLDQHKLIHEPVEAVRGEIAALRKELAEEKAKTEHEAKLTALQRKIESGNASLLKEGWTSDGLKKLDEFREKEGIIDPVLAAAAYERLHGAQTTPAQPTNGGFGAWNFASPPKEGEDFVKKLLESKGENDMVVEAEAKKIISDFRGR